MKAEVFGAGAVAGVVTVVLGLSLSALVFSGPLAPAFGLAAMTVLAAAGVMNLILARTSSLPGVVMTPQDATSAVLATALTAALAGLATDVATSTGFAIIAIASATTATVMLVLGGFRVGSLVRYIPYPVIGGFLAGTGILLLRGAAELMTDGFDWSAATVASLIGGSALGLLLLFVSARRLHPWAVPGLIAGAAAVFYVVLAVLGISMDEARSLGLIGGSGGRIGLPSVEFGPVEWSAVVASVPAIVTVPIVAVVSLLLNVGGLEFVSGRDANLDGELRAAGLANLAGAAGGAPAGYHALSLSAVGYRAGVTSRSVTVVVGLVCLIGAIAGPVLVSFMPMPVIGSMLAMLGFSFVFDWVVGGIRRMTHIEYLLMLVIVAGLVVLGFLIGIAFGLAAAVLLFTATYSRLQQIRHSFTAAERSSSVERSASDREFLAAQGRRVRIVELEGFVFFGTAHSVSKAVMGMLETGSVAVVLDLRRVQGMDSTGVLAFAKLSRDLAGSGIQLVVSHAPEAVEAAFARSHLSVERRVVFTPDLDHALEYCERLLLADASEGSANPWFLPDEFWHRLVPHMERVTVETGGVIAELGEHSRCVFIVESGRVAAEIPVASERWQRVSSAGPGGVFGEISLYGDGHRSARLRAEQGGVVLRLSPEAIAGLEASDPGCAIAFHRALARVLSERLVTSNEFVRALVR